MPNVDRLDDEKQYLQITNMSAGQYSFQHPTDKLYMPDNAGAELLNIDIDKIGKRTKRDGYTLIGDDLGSNRFNGLIGYYPVGGAKQLLGEVNGTIYKWTGSGNWASSKTGLTAATLSTMLIAKGLVFRLSQTDDIFSYDGSSWTDEGSSTVEGGGTDPPKGKVGIWTANQRFLLGNTSINPNLIWPSDAGDPQTFGDASFSFGDRDNDGVTGMVEFTDGEVVVFTRDEMFTWNITDTTSTNWTVKKVSDVGCIASKSLNQIGPDVLFLSRDGVRSVVQSAQDKKRGDSVPLSYPIHDWIQRINWNSASNAVSWVWNDVYMLAVPIDGATYNNYVLAFSRRAFEANSARGGWTIYDNMNVADWAVMDFSGIRRLYFAEASADGKAYVFKSDRSSDASYSDNGTAITFQETSKRYDFGTPSVDKTFVDMEVELLEKGTGEVKVEVQIDGEGWTELNQSPISQNVDLPQLPIDLPFDLKAGQKIRKKLYVESLGRGRNVQVRLTENTDAVNCEILSWTMGAFIENVEFE